MNWVECILIIAGISLDIFAAMEIQGAMLSQVKKTNLMVAFLIVVLLQLGFFFGGYFACHVLDVHYEYESAFGMGEYIAVAIFALLGIRLIFKAIKREFIDETRKDAIRAIDYIRTITITSLYTLAAGCACGFLGTHIWYMMITIIVCSFLVVSGGLYTGYHFGFENKTIAYAIGAILLWGVGVEILVRGIIA